MPLAVRRQKKFKKDVKRILKQGKIAQKLRDAIILLANEEKLPPNYYDHALSGNYIGTRECHLEPDWLLIYFYDDNELVLVRTGSHTELFG